MARAALRGISIVTSSIIRSNNYEIAENVRIAISFLFVVTNNEKVRITTSGRGRGHRSGGPAAAVMGGEKTAADAASWRWRRRSVDVNVGGGPHVLLLPR